ncbi:MAG: dTMP kinase [Candidatus Dojkabacteria bacterium]|jgi:dTMP kinase|nr:dTMP kinase [Candidatus Dojkabacteria bacterium]
MEFKLEEYLGPERCNHQLMAAVYKRAVQESTSPSHDIHHINNVLHYALILYHSIPENQGISWQRIFIAACLHDLGRNNTALHQAESLTESTRLAGIILAEFEVPEQEIRTVLEIISQHDQPDLRPDSIESLLLKEADFLAGMGTTGIMRTLLWAGECGRPITQIVQILTEKMPARIASLQLSISRAIAAKLWLRAQHFLAQYLEEQNGYEIETYPGKLIIFEGISGAGKGTQIELLTQHLEALGKEVVVIAEPSGLFRTTLGQWKTERGQVDALERRFLLLADRVTTAKRVEELLRAGVIVILDRSFISTMVYQGTDYLGMAEVLLEHGFFPTPDLIFLLNIDAKTALARIESGLAAGKRGVRGDYEQLELLKKNQRLYMQALQLIPASVPCKILDTSETIEDVQVIVREILIDQGILIQPATILDI